MSAFHPSKPKNEAFPRLFDADQCNKTMVAASGTNSCSSPSRFGLQGRIEVEDPGGVAPRSVEASDEAAGNGIVSEYSNDWDRFVAAIAARAEASPPTVTRMATGRRTSSDAMAGRRSYSPSAHRYSIATV